MRNIDALIINPEEMPMEGMPIEQLGMMGPGLPEEGGTMDGY